MVAGSCAWWIGDWLLFGQQAYGQRYKAAAEETGFDYQTLRNYAWVASRFELSRRRDSLSFQHHAEVCALSNEQQEAWLDLASERGRVLALRRGYDPRVGERVPGQRRLIELGILLAHLLLRLLLRDEGHALHS